MRKGPKSIRPLILLLSGSLAAATFPPEGRAADAPCAVRVAEAVSVQGTVQIRRTGGETWEPVAYGDGVCPGDSVWVRERSRADFALINETFLRLDQNTRAVFSEPAGDPFPLVNVLSGSAYVISRTPRRFRVETPFVNAGVEGTEFFVRVDAGETFMTVFEGRVTAENDAGRLVLREGQSAVARGGEAPALRVEVRPRDAVRWTLYYPPVLYLGPGETPAEGAGDARARVFRAGGLLSAGRIEEAEREVDAVLAASPRDGAALALRSVIAVAGNDKERALALAREAVAADPRSVPALLSLSYALQARFDLEGAAAALADAAEVAPGNALVRARKAEIHLSRGELGAALAEAKKAVGADPGLSRARTVLGFVSLARDDAGEAAAAAKGAALGDQADPLPRLCLGLALIRKGDLPAGRREIEIAASLDPGNALVRSYLGKAYFEEKRDGPAAGQLALAKELDPLDPTPFFYDAIRKQAANRPVEALHDLNRSIALNDNRAVYRSRLLLDEDLASQEATLGNLYGDLGFRQLALVEGWTSAASDPSNASAHRFLADSYSALPRHEIARVSELLQSQLLQPLALTPVTPRLAESSLPLPAGSGPAGPSLLGFGPMFLRDRATLQAAGVAGEEETWGDEAVLAGVLGPLSGSVGHFRFLTDGFRGNADQERTVVNAFLQGRLSPGTSLMAEYRDAEAESGDLAMRALGDFSLTTRNVEENRQIRAGLRHSFSPGEVLLFSLVYRDDEATVRETDPAFPFDVRGDKESAGGEIQHHHRAGRLHLVAGGGLFRIDTRFDVASPLFTSASESNDNHSNAYLYAHFRAAEGVTVTAGGSGDFIHQEVVSRGQFDPKAGITVALGKATTLRAAAFRTLRRPFVSNQTLEPTQVAGFNQFFDEADGTRAWRYGLALDRKLSADLFAGAEISRRDIRTPFLDGFTGSTGVADWEERTGRAYLYWTPCRQAALGAEYVYERFARDPVSGIEFERVRTHTVPLRGSWFHPWGLFGRAQASFVDQEGAFFPLVAIPGTPSVPAENAFWIVDAAAGYRLPRRLGIVALEARNLFDRSFRFQETDPAHPSVLPGRIVVLKATLSL